MYPDFNSVLGYVRLGIISEKVLPTNNDESFMAGSFAIYPNPTDDYGYVITNEVQEN